jgi:hypothetical protein
LSTVWYAPGLSLFFRDKLSQKLISPCKLQGEKSFAGAEKERGLFFSGMILGVQTITPIKESPAMSRIIPDYALE